MKLNELESLLFQPELPYMFEGVKIAVTLRGEEEGYGFNLGRHVGDDFGAVEKRRDLLTHWLGVPIVWLNQVHGCEVCEADPNVHPVSADASITQDPGMALAVMTADCLPVLFVAIDERGKALAVGAAHAGWRGLLAGVLERCAGQLAAKAGVPLKQVHAWMGPAIGPESFEVGNEVYEAFMTNQESAVLAFKQALGAGKWLVDIYTLARLRLKLLGSVSGGGFDTLTDHRWHSYRRGGRLHQPAGRMAAVIRMLP